MRRSLVVHSFIPLILLLTITASRAGEIPEVFKRVSPSVVIVHTKERALQRVEGGTRLTSASGLGSGVLISPDGKVLTAAHVVQAADHVAVQFPDGTLAGAVVTASEPAADVALLQIDRLPASAVAAPLGDSDRAVVGEEVFVVGAPFGISHTLTVGHISARRAPNSMVGGMEMAELFQTDAAINQGNSGGPMFNLQGEVIGIVSHILSYSGGFEGLGFAVTSNMARRLLLEGPSYWSGMEGYMLTEDLARAFNLPQDAGILVQRVAEGSPAEKLGLRPGTMTAEIEGEALILGGDVILDVMGIRIGDTDSRRQIREALGQRAGLGRTIRVTVLRDGQRVELSELLP